MRIDNWDMDGSSRATFYVHAVLLDIEGTTTSISFVKDTLFPYVMDHVRQHCQQNWDSEECQRDVQSLRMQALADQKEGLDGVPLIPPASQCTKEQLLDAVVDSVLWLTKNDRKVTALKQLQGHIWREAYKKGEVVGHVYPDAACMMKAWHEAGFKVYIYSSGSVEAQKLLFGYSEAGDLLKFVSGHFDTKIGGKKQLSSYQAIAREVGLEPLHILFLTDVIEEAKAAEEAGFKVALTLRPGNSPLSDESRKLFPMVEDFSSFNLQLPAPHSPPPAKRAKLQQEESS